MRKLKIIATVTFLSLALIVLFQNTEDVEARLLFYDVTMPRAALLTITLVMGFALGMLTSLVMSRKATKAKNEAESQP